jgi:AcrR family transcriptional regulator
MSKAATLPAADTRQRLLEAAAQVFAERGYRSATVREIVRRAGGANLAAVNYHFRDKEGLYTAVLEHFFQAAVAKHPPDGGLPADASPEEQLHAFVRALLLRLFDQQALHGRLMAREMVEPTRALDRIVEQVVRPLYGRLCAILKALSAPGTPLARIEQSAKSVVGQCLFYKLCGPVLQRLEGRLPDLQDVDALATHVAAFSIRGFQGLRAKGGGR